MQALAPLNKLGRFLGVKPGPENLGLRGIVSGGGRKCCMWGKGRYGGTVTLWPTLLYTEAIYVSVPYNYTGGAAVAYLMVIRPTPVRAPRTVNSSQKSMVRKSAHPRISR